MNRSSRFIDYADNLSRICFNQKRFIYILLILIAFLCFIISRISLRKIEYLIPYNINEKIFVSVNKVSKEYLTSLAMADAATYFDIDRYNIETQTQIFLSRIDPEFMGKVSIELNSRKEKIVSDNLSQVFYPVNFYVKKDSNFVVLKGRLVKLLSGKIVQSSIIKLSVDYSNINGHIFIKKWTYDNV